MKKSENIEALANVIANINDCYEYYKNGVALDKIGPILEKSADDLLKISEKIEKERPEPTYILAKFMKKGKKLDTRKLAQHLLNSDIR